MHLGGRALHKSTIGHSKGSAPPPLWGRSAASTSYKSAGTAALGQADHHAVLVEADALSCGALAQTRHSAHGAADSVDVASTCSQATTGLKLG